MRGSPIVGGRRAIDRRTQERMPEGDPRAHFDHALLLGGAHRVDREPELGRRPPQQCRLARRLGSSDE